MPSTSNSSLPCENQDYPLLPAHPPGATVAWHNGQAISRERFLQDVHDVTARLPAGRHAINLCENRYRFLVGFTALLVNHQTNLLPPNRALRMLEEIAHEYPGSYCLCDSSVPDIGIAVHRIDVTCVDHPPEALPVPLIPGQNLAAIAFTSGSTGRARPNPKYWADLVTGAQMLQHRFGFGLHDPQQIIVATVPPQHMYGLETSILNPLVNGVSVYTDTTFFPADIQAALHRVPTPRILVTTPVHMKACLDARLLWPEIAYVISATAPLEVSLAERAEHRFDCPVLEIYGCTESGSLASRRTLDGREWLLYEGSCLRQTPGGHSVCGPNLPADVPLHDVIEPLGNRRFLLHGRHADMVNMAGKRASLEDLNIRLRSIEGVEDAVFVIPDPDHQRVSRLAALVVAPELDTDVIRKQLALLIDPAFLPRPLHRVEKLPRNETGKLPRAALQELLRQVRTGD